MRFLNSIWVFFAVILFVSLGIAHAERDFYPEIDVYCSVRDGSITQDYEVFIDDSGMVTVVEKDYYHKLRTPRVIKSRKMSPQESMAFKNLIVKTDVFQFEDDYVGSADAMDLASKKLKFNIGQRKKEIVVSVSDIPPELEDVMDRIEEIKERTIGPRR